MKELPQTGNRRVEYRDKESGKLWPASSSRAMLLETLFLLLGIRPDFDGTFALRIRNWESQLVSVCIGALLGILVYTGAALLQSFEQLTVGLDLPLNIQGKLPDLLAGLSFVAYITIPQMLYDGFSLIRARRFPVSFKAAGQLLFIALFVIYVFFNSDGFLDELNHYLVEGLAVYAIYSLLLPLAGSYFDL